MTIFSDHHDTSVWMEIKLIINHVFFKTPFHLAYIPYLKTQMTSFPSKKIHKQCPSLICYCQVFMNHAINL